MANIDSRRLTSNVNYSKSKRKHKYYGLKRKSLSFIPHELKKGKITKKMNNSNLYYEEYQILMRFAYTTLYFLVTIYVISSLFFHAGKKYCFINISHAFRELVTQPLMVL